jgi:hypothetical protein
MRAYLSALMLLGAPTIHGQGIPAKPGHYEGVLAVSPWGADAKAFEVRAGGSRMEATVAVSQTGVGWLYKQTTFQRTMKNWEEITSWCRSGPDVMITFQGHPTSFGLYGFSQEQFASVVKYFEQYVPELEVAGEGRGCPRVIVPPGR